jgi:hypothetical protein
MTARHPNGMPVFDPSTMIGKRFGRWLILSYECKAKNRDRRWLCRCDCGTEAVRFESTLKYGTSRSCGCLKDEVAYIDGRSQCREGKVWRHMLERCCDPTDKRYARYGGRGIKICDRWRKSFLAFYEDMGSRPPGMTLDRIDNDGDYEPGNCRWATLTEQARNRRTNHLVEYQGQTKTIAEWAEIYNIKASIIYDRIGRGWAFEAAVTKAPRVFRKSEPKS